MKLFNRKQVITMAFSTSDKHNRLSQADQFALIEKLSRAFGGATLRENVGGYIRDDNGAADIEYSYTIELLNVKAAAVKPVAQAIASDNDQESYIFNGKLVFTDK